MVCSAFFSAVFRIQYNPPSCKSPQISYIITRLSGAYFFLIRSQLAQLASFPAAFHGAHGDRHRVLGNPKHILDWYRVPRQPARRCRLRNTGCQSPCASGKGKRHFSDFFMTSFPLFCNLAFIIINWRIRKTLIKPRENLRTVPLVPRENRPRTAINQCFPGNRFLGCRIVRTN